MQLLGQKHIESVSPVANSEIPGLGHSHRKIRKGYTLHTRCRMAWVGYFCPVATFKICQDMSSMSNITSAESESLWLQNVYSCFKVIFKISNSFAKKCHLPSISFSTESKWKKESSAQRVTSALFYEPCCHQWASDVGNTTSELLKMVLKI